MRAFLLVSFFAFFFHATGADLEGKKSGAEQALSAIDLMMVTFGTLAKTHGRWVKPLSSERTAGIGGNFCLH